jgi:hypothetical protein
LNTEYYTTPVCIAALASILASSPELAVRRWHTSSAKSKLIACFGTCFYFRFANLQLWKFGNELPTKAVTCGSNLLRTIANRSKLNFPRSYFLSKSGLAFHLQVNLSILTRLFTSKAVRHSAARVVGAIAAIEIPQGNWSQLLPFLHQTATSNEVSHREVGVFILFTVLESIVEGFQEQLQSFFKLFETLLVDPDSIEVRITTVRLVALSKTHLPPS